MLPDLSVKNLTVNNTRHVMSDTHCPCTLLALPFFAGEAPSISNCLYLLR